ncbi:MAG: hypothetical protein LBS17_05945 [Actinomycetes bacterium]|jgi:hypothetical protein|nr:hypothetical protein [Actinomycetes bacterium]
MRIRRLHVLLTTVAVLLSVTGAAPLIAVAVTGDAGGVTVQQVTPETALTQAGDELRVRVSANAGEYFFRHLFLSLQYRKSELRLVSADDQTDSFSGYSMPAAYASNYMGYDGVVALTWDGTVSNVPLNSTESVVLVFETLAGFYANGAYPILGSADIYVGPVNHLGYNIYGDGSTEQWGLSSTQMTIDLMGPYSPGYPMATPYAEIAGIGSDGYGQFYLHGCVPSVNIQAPDIVVLQRRIGQLDVEEVFDNDVCEAGSNWFRLVATNSHDATIAADDLVYELSVPGGTDGAPENPVVVLADAIGPGTKAVRVVGVSGVVRVTVSLASDPAVRDTVDVVVPGDADRDGIIAISDVSAVNMYVNSPAFNRNVTGFGIWDSFAPLLADVNRSGYLDISDVIALNTYVNSPAFARNLTNWH